MAQQGNLPTLQRTNKSRSKRQLDGMKRSQSQSCTMRSVHSTLNRRYENVQKITTLLQDYQSKDINKSDKKIHEVVVEGFKQKIRNTFNQLYGDYDQNKQTISHQIRNIQKNKTSHIEMNSRLEQTLRQKNQLDKIKLEVDVKKKKLQKLREMVQVQNSAKTESEKLQDDLRDKTAELKEHEDLIESLDYQKSVLDNMKTARRELKQSLKKRFNDMFQDYSEKARKISKYFDDNEVKRKKVADLSKQLPEQQIGIPENFAIVLEDKLQLLYGKEAFQNIFYHQNIINEQSNKQEMERQMLERDSRRKIKEQMERQEKRQLDRIEGEYLKNQTLQENFLKQCGVRSLDQIIHNNTQENRQALRQLKLELEENIRQTDKDNDLVEKEIYEVLSRNTSLETTIRDIQNSYDEEHDEEKKLAYQGQKNTGFLESLEYIIDRITEQPGPIEDMNLKLASFSSKYERFSLLEPKPKKDKKNKFFRVPVPQLDRNQTDNTEIDREGEYLESQFQHAKII